MKRIIGIMMMIVLLGACSSRSGERIARPLPVIGFIDMQGYIDSGCARVIGVGESITTVVLKTSKFQDSLIYTTNRYSGDYKFLDYKKK